MDKTIIFSKNIQAANKLFYLTQHWKDRGVNVGISTNTDMKPFGMKTYALEFNATEEILWKDVIEKLYEHINEHIDMTGNVNTLKEVYFHSLHVYKKEFNSYPNGINPQCVSISFVVELSKRPLIKNIDILNLSPKYSFSNDTDTVEEYIKKHFSFRSLLKLRFCKNL